MHSDCCYAQKTFDTVDDLADFIRFEQQKEQQKERYKKISLQDPITLAAQKAAAEQITDRVQTKLELENGNTLNGIDESEIHLPSIFMEKNH